MKYTALLIAALLVSSAMCEGHWGYTEEDDVVVLSKDNFDEFVNKHKFALVEFYAPWCGHCKKLAPEYSKAAQKLKNADPSIPLVKIDATKEAELGTRFEVSGYPSLKFFINGNPIEYTGGRTTDEIVDWVEKKTGPASKALETAAALESFKTDNKVGVVFFGEANAAFQTFQSTAAGIDKMAFAHSHSAELVAEYGNRVVLFKQFDEGRNDLEGEFDSASMTTFIENHRYEIVMTFEGDVAIERIFGKEAAAVFLFTETEGPHVQIFQQAAKQNQNRIVWSQSTVTSGLGQRLAEYVGVSADQAPCVRLVNPSNGDLAKFTYEGDITVDGLSKFVSDFEGGALSRNFKSQDIPLTNDEPVKVLVGKNFNEIVMESDADVMVEFYAPWCGHCKTLAPKYDAMAAKLKSNSNIVIAKMDATENEVEGVSIKGFPTIKFYKKGNKQSPMDFDGDRTEEGMMKFLKENTSHAWVDEAVETDL